MRNAIKLALVLGMSAATQAAMADGEGWYAGVGFGQTKAGDWISKSEMLSLHLDAAASAGVFGFPNNRSASSDDSDTGWKLYGGYAFNQNIAVEAMYADLGEATAKASSSGPGFVAGVGSVNGTISTKVAMESKAIAVDGVGKINVAPWLDLFGKLGIYRSDLELKVSVNLALNAGNGSASDSESDSSTGAHLALGADFNVSPNVFIRAEWERFANVEFQDGEADIDMLSVSAAYKF